jgi:hypothetical protein
VLLAKVTDPMRSKARRVAIVGTRSATPHWAGRRPRARGVPGRCRRHRRERARIGIDAAAHSGAVDAGGLAVGVVATGLDVVYPRRHRALYAQVKEQGLVVGEHGYGVQPAARAVPGTQSHHCGARRDRRGGRGHRDGGARITAKYAAEYGRQVFALPGSRPKPGRRGMQFAPGRRRRGAARSRRPPDRAGARGSQPGDWRSAGRVPPTDDDEAAVMRALGGDPGGIDDLERATLLARPAWERLSAASNGPAGSSGCGGFGGPAEESGRPARSRTGAVPAARPFSFSEISRDFLCGADPVPYDSTPIEAEGLSGGSMLLTCDVLRRGSGNGTAPGCGGYRNPTAKRSATRTPLRAPR